MFNFYSFIGCMNHTSEVNCTCSKDETVTFVPQGWSHVDIACFHDIKPVKLSSHCYSHTLNLKNI